MEFRHLRCFVVLADELHFGRAASRLAMSQPPLSVNIRQLEEAIGARLFERNSKGVSLTAAGLAFRPQALALLSKAEEARALARDVGAGSAGRLRIGFIGSMLFRGLPAMLQRFQASHERLELVLHELSSQEQIEALIREELDLAFIQGDRVPAPLRCKQAGVEPFVACLPEGHPAAQRRSIKLATLADDPFVLFSRSSSPDYYERIIGMCGDAGFYPRVRHEVRHWLSVVAIVAQGMGVSVVPAPMKRSAIRGAVFRPLTGVRMESKVAAAWHGEIDQPARDRFLEGMR
ncbi:MAG: LysR family transcriptional regulator [Proteobacteria bacterium]|nr:LysR family transcriptional regulator [Pseudomonadota bacterium]